jgi:hypothetical protein
MDTNFYKCSSCEYRTSQKTNLIRHQKRKNSTCAVELKQVPDEAAFPCRNEGCESTFKYFSGRARHEKKCALKVSQTIETSGSHSPAIGIAGDHNTQTVDNSITNNNNIVILNFNEFLPAKISPEEFKAKMVAGGPIDTILSCIFEQQFNEAKPENMNVFISNLKDKVARVYDGDRWSVRNGEDVTDDVFRRYKSMIDDMISEVEDEEDKIIFREIAKLVHKWNKQTDHYQFDDVAKKEVLLALYNLRDIVKKTHNVGNRS